jgi:hypothetical protein
MCSPAQTININVVHKTKYSCDICGKHCGKKEALETHHKLCSISLYNMLYRLNNNLIPNDVFTNQKYNNHFQQQHNLSQLNVNSMGVGSLPSPYEMIKEPTVEPVLSVEPVIKQVKLPRITNIKSLFNNWFNNMAFDIVSSSSEDETNSFLLDLNDDEPVIDEPITLKPKQKLKVKLSFEDDKIKNYLSKDEIKSIKSICRINKDFYMKFENRVYSSNFDYYENLYLHIYYSQDENIYYVDDTDASNYLIYINKDNPMDS